MPEEGISLTENSKLLTTPELQRLVSLFASMGVNKIRLTGGEPLVRPDVEKVCEIIASTEGIRTVGMTTNGILLPRKIHALHAAGLNALNISLDTLDESKFMLVTRRKGLAKVLDSIRLAEHLGYNPVKVNCVVMRGVNDDEIPDFVKMTKDRPLEVRFIEFMPFDDNKWSRAKMVPFMEMMDRVEKYLASVAPQPEFEESVAAGLSNKGNPASSSVPAPLGTPLVMRNGAEYKSRFGFRLKHVPGGETASIFQAPGYRGRIGFITSMTDHFCSSCNRLRLTADGNLKVCLFGEDELSLTKLMREGASDNELEVAIRGAVTQKHFSHGGKVTPEDISQGHNRPMIKIGG
jgi:molybdenum cofactor biosynthesis enzyme MoaA